MSSKHILFLLILMVCISLSVSRRRRRVNCRRMDCQVSRWSSWSACSSDVQCGQSVTRDRRRTVQIPASCGGTPCPSLLEAVPCQGTLRVDCQLSSWSTWSACSLLRGGSQTSSRYVATHEQCGGTACNSRFSKTRACNITRCLGKCSCTPRFYGGCCPNKVCQVPDCNGCCNAKTYKEINDPRRSTGSVWNKGERALCDRGLQWGWYRFTSFAGGKMPEVKVDSDHCGTHAPIWLNGRHPTKKGENVVRQACVNAFERNGGCWDHFDMNITNCGDYYVYYLRPPNYCSAAYCAGYKKPCPYGKDGEPPICLDQPQEFSSDNLGTPEISINGDPEGVVEVTLRCKVNILNGIDKWRNVTYIIEWFSEGKSLLKNETICGGYILGKVYTKSCPENGELVSKLSGGMYKIGQWISCNASAKFTTGRNVWSLPKTVREPFFAGLQFYPRTTILKLETCGLSMDTITVTPTIPARKSPWTDRFPMISLWLPPEIKLVNESQCQIPLDETATIELQIMATCPKNGNDITPGLKAIVPEISNFHSDFWTPSKCGDPPTPLCGDPISLPTIWVSVVKKADYFDTCRSVTDPHYTALNGEYYDFMGLGDYILYKNTERNFEVQTRQWACNDAETISCNCGAVLRDHNDVIEFNCCNKDRKRDKTTPITVKIRSKKCLAPGISIKNIIQGINAKYEVLFPSGAKVVIRRNYWGLDVIIDTPRADDINNEKGLCLGSDPIHQISLGFSENYFDTLPPYVQDKHVQYSHACLCLKNDMDTTCKSVFDAAFRTLEKEDMTPMKLKHESPRDLCDRQKRDVHFSDDPTEEDFQLFKQSPQLHSRFRRYLSSGPVSKENATRYCAERISDTKIGKLCAKVGVNVQALVNICSADVEYTGDFSFATGSVALLMNECGELGARNISMFANDSSADTTAAAAALVEEVAELLCPNDCTFKGKCVNGSCVCNKDYTAEDCSMSIYQRPTLSRLQSDGLCDRHKRPCRKVTVFGADFLNSTNMTCHVKEFKVVNGSWTPNNTELRFPGIMTDLVLADCHLPESPVTQGYFHETDEGTPAAGLMISVSNDGEHRSYENLTFISYDSACMNCSVSSGCSLKNKSCFINRYCFAPNETNPIDWCYQCLPEVNTKAWTKRQVNLPPTFSPTTKYFGVFQETLELTIDVVDPEGMPVTVLLLDGSPNTAFVRDKMLIWNVTNDAKTQFFLKATDACHATSFGNITVSLNVCPCQNNGSCAPHPNEPRGSGYYECNCVPGFTGDKCGTNIDECQSYPCFRGRCIDGLNKYSCICDPGYVGTKCDTDYDDCSSSPCIHGKCTDYTDAYRCTCDPGYSGENCTINIDECESSPCKLGTCVDQVNNYTCQCQDGYTGYDCDVEIDECQSSPCVRGTCVDKINKFTCVCPTGFTGVKCEENIDDCLSSPCLNGTCVDLVNNYTCICYVGFTGSNCDIKITNCTHDTCYPNVTCFKNSETISCGPCPFGLSGDGKNCEDIDYCVNHTCSNGGSCVDGISNYTCNCLAGFTGDRCETDIDDCVNDSCQNSGSCIDGINNFTCSCQKGYTGKWCEKDIDECANVTCYNNGTCNDGVNRYSCLCQRGFTGQHCEKDIDDCVSNDCGNGATCVDGINQYSCICAEDFTGNLCESEVSTTLTTEISGSTTRTSTQEEHVTTEPTTETVTEEHKSDFTFEIRVYKEWDARLQDKTSDTFKKLSSLLKEEISKAYSGVHGLKEIKIISMRPGSTVVDFQLIFETKVTPEEALAPLKKVTADGKLGSLNVEPGSLKPKSTKKEDNKEKETSSNLPLIIGISVGSFVFVAVVMICLVFHCKRPALLRNNSRISDGMPVEGGYSKAEKYELQVARPNVSGSWADEKGHWNEGMDQ